MLVKNIIFITAIILFLSFRSLISNAQAMPSNAFELKGEHESLNLILEMSITPQHREDNTNDKLQKKMTILSVLKPSKQKENAENFNKQGRSKSLAQDNDLLIEILDISSKVLFQVIMSDMSELRFEQFDSDGKIENNHSITLNKTNLDLKIPQIKGGYILRISKLKLSNNALTAGTILLDEKLEYIIKKATFSSPKSP